MYCLHSMHGLVIYVHVLSNTTTRYAYGNNKFALIFFHFLCRIKNGNLLLIAILRANLLSAIYTEKRDISRYLPKMRHKKWKNIKGKCLALPCLAPSCNVLSCLSLS